LLILLIRSREHRSSRQSTISNRQSAIHASVREEPRQEVVVLRALTLAPLFVLVAAPHTPIDLNRERDRVVTAARKYIAEAPITITASSSPRSAGGLHDSFSEGDYWWP